MPAILLRNTFHHSRMIDEMSDECAAYKRLPQSCVKAKLGKFVFMRAYCRKRVWPAFLQQGFCQQNSLLGQLVFHISGHIPFPFGRALVYGMYIGDHQQGNHF